MKVFYYLNIFIIFNLTFSLFLKQNFYNFQNQNLKIQNENKENENQKIENEENKENKENKSLEISIELYLYSWPLIISKLTRKSMFYCPDNRMMPLPVFPNPNLTAIVRPNVDTLYDACWINHNKANKLLLTIPNTENGVYFLFPLMVLLLILLLLFSLLY